MNNIAALPVTVNQTLKPVKRIANSHIEYVSLQDQVNKQNDANIKLRGSTKRLINEPSEDESKSKSVKIASQNGVSVKVKTTPVKKISEKVKNKLEKIAVRSDGSIRPFSEIEISTKTAVVITNCSINLENFFKYIPITDYDPPIKKRGRKPSSLVEKKVQKLPIGSVPRVQYEHRIRGCTNLKQRGDQQQDVTVKQEKQKEIKIETPRVDQPYRQELNEDEEELPDPSGKVKKKMSYFLHCVVIDVAIDNQNEDPDQNFKNVKVYSNGKLHITGCKNDEQYVETVRSIFKLFSVIEDYTNEQVVTCKDTSYKAVFNTVMKNMDFYIGFNIFRNKLDEFINHSDMQEFRSIFEGSLNTGVNIKIPIQKFDDILMAIDYNHQTNVVKKTWVNYNDYKQYFVRKGNKEPAHTFLVFATGHVIFTSCGPEMEQMYYRCIELLIKNRNFFEEKDSKS